MRGRDAAVTTRCFGGLKERFYALLNRVGHCMLCVLGQVQFVKRMFDV